MDVPEHTKVLQVSPQDAAGGAERVALDLHRGFLRRGMDARLLVRFRRRELPAVFEADVYEGVCGWGGLLGLLDQWLSKRPHFKGRDSLRMWLSKAASPRRWYNTWRGLDDFNYPYAARLLSRPDWRPDVVHLHNLHARYFDLRALPALSETAAVVWTLHDTWALTGHCAYFIDCPRWVEGCGHCPDLARPPSARRDRTADNWRIKRDIYQRSRLHVVCPSQWLMSQVEQSMLQPATKHVIPYGVDLSVFKPDDKSKARQSLGLDPHAFIGLFVSVSGAAGNPYKDYTTIEHAVRKLAVDMPGGQMRFVCLGGKPQTQNVNPLFSFPGFLRDAAHVALYYQAADVYLHAAIADNFPCAILEAQACGLPVVATAVGGIPEQVQEGLTGYLVPRGDSIAIVERLKLLMGDQNALMKLSQAAALRAAQLYDLEHQIDDYLNLYRSLTGSMQDIQVQ
jgi:glycosyltransferase involved in cell wall biosynthesis